VVRKVANSEVAAPLGAGTGGEDGFRIPMMFHPSHDVPDLAVAEDFYRRVFGCESWSLASIQAGGRPAAHRGTQYPRGYSTFTPISDVCFDTIDPAKYVFEGVQRLASVDEPHLRLISWYVDGVSTLYRKLRRNGIRILDQLDEVVQGDNPPVSYGGATVLLFTVPEDTGLRYSFMPVTTIPFDARLKPGWVVPPASENPLGIERCSHHTILTDRPERVMKLHCHVLGGMIIHEGRDELLGSSSSFVHLAGSTLEFAVPDRGTAAYEDWKRAAPNDTYHSLTWKVADLEAAGRHLAAQGVRIRFRSPDAFVTDPATSLGVPWGFTTSLVPGDPRSSLRQELS
jgi:catechol 2,3-dioxygenase-like lactoylglutathione lyase family enzyme